MKKNLLKLLILIFIYLIFNNYSLVLNTTILGVNLWLNKVFPYLFIMIFLNDALINLGFSNNFSNPIHYIFIMSLLSGSPTSAYIINSLYKDNIINIKEANTSLMFTYFGNPLFLLSIFNLIFHNQKITIKLMFIHYISNIIIYLFVKKRLNKHSLNYKTSSFKITSSLKKSMDTNILVLGSICLFLIINAILIKVFNLNGINKIIISGLLEVTQGLNNLINLKISYKLKEILASFFVSFGGLAIHLQIKCLLDENNLSYKSFLKGRIYQSLLAAMITTIT